MAFTRKNLSDLSSRLKRNMLLKGLILFFLGASATLLVAYGAEEITPYINNVVMYMKRIVLTPNGVASGTTGVVLDGVSGSVAASLYCDTAGYCVDIKDVALKLGTGGMLRMWVDRQSQTFSCTSSGQVFSLPGAVQCGCDVGAGVECGSDSGYLTFGTILAKKIVNNCYDLQNAATCTANGQTISYVLYNF